MNIEKIPQLSYESPVTNDYIIIQTSKNVTGILDDSIISCALVACTLNGMTVNLTLSNATLMIRGTFLPI